MDVAIGLPNAVPGTTGAELTEWARRAEDRGFSSLGTIDRVVYEAFERGGCDELILFPSSADPAQVDLLADAADL
jgi:hypothetical protein